MRNQQFIMKKHIIMESISYVLLLFSFIIAIIGMISVDGEIAIHYDFLGKPDDYGSPIFLLMMPGTLLLCNVLCSVMVHFINVSKWNMPCKIKPGRELISYATTVSMVFSIEILVGIFLLYYSITSILEIGSGLGIVSFLFLGVILIDVGYFIVKMIRLNK